MAIAPSNSGNSSSNNPCNCYVIPYLTSPILESSHTSHLLERYELGNQLGSGQFGIIRECTDIFTGEKFACKSIAKDRLITHDDVRNIKLEIEIMSRLSGHPNVVDLKAVYEEEHYVHLVMELCAGGELFHLLEKNGRFPESNARVLFRHLMEVVVYCHDKGVVHRDLKPENILLATKLASSPIKLADFGLATYIKPGQSLYGTVGSPFYIAPEVLAGGYNQAADVWSAGVILYILLSGIPPFWGKTKSRIFDAVKTAELQFPLDPWDHVSSAAKDLICGMLCRNPAQRLTAAQVLGHSWIRESAQQYLVPRSQDRSFNYEQTDLGSYSFSNPLNSRVLDFSFGSGPPTPDGALPDFSSPAFTCKSSFSSSLVGATPSTPNGNGGFSFRSCGESGSVGLSSPIPSMPSFSFFSPPSPKEESNRLAFAANRSKGSTIQRDSSFIKLFTTPASSAARELELRGVEARRGEAMTTSRALGIHSKRNRTIGLGELEQIDLIVTESIIRWASCTNLPNAASLRSSLVC